jgi:hypothetical protein
MCLVSRSDGHVPPSCFNSSSPPSRGPYRHGLILPIACLDGLIGCRTARRFGRSAPNDARIFGWAISRTAFLAGLIYPSQSANCGAPRSVGHWAYSCPPRDSAFLAPADKAHRCKDAKALWQPHRSPQCARCSNSPAGLCPCYRRCPPPPCTFETCLAGSPPPFRRDIQTSHWDSTVRTSSACLSPIGSSTSHARGSESPTCTSGAFD